MRFYRVDVGPALFLAGQVLTLNPAQIAPRRHALEVPKEYDGKKPAIVTARQAIEFKRGEKIGLPELSPAYTGKLVPLGQPVSDEDKIAIAKAAARQAEAAAAAKSKEPDQAAA